MEEMDRGFVEDREYGYDKYTILKLKVTYSGKWTEGFTEGSGRII